MLTLRATVSPDSLLVEKTSPKVPSPIFRHCFIRWGRMHSSQGRGRCWPHSAYTFSASDKSASSQTFNNRQVGGGYVHPQPGCHAIRSNDPNAKCRETNRKSEYITYVCLIPGNAGPAAVTGAAWGVASVRVW